MAQKILILDDDPFVIQSMAEILNGHYEVLAAFTTADTLALLKKHIFALTILDLDLGKQGSGLDLIQAIRAKCSKVLVVTTSDNEANLLACLRAEVAGFVHKRKAILNLLALVKGAIAGHNMTDPALLKDLTEEKIRLPRFSWRENQLINLLYRHPDASTAEYATMMNLEPGSVKNIFTHLFDKMAVRKKISLLEALKARGHQPVDLSNTD